MKIISIFLLLSLFASCNNISNDVVIDKNKIDTVQTTKRVKILDTISKEVDAIIFIDLDSINRIDSLINSKYKKLSNKEIIDLLIQLGNESSLTSCFSNVSFNYWNDNVRTKLNEIPLPIYQEIFPDNSNYIDIHTKIIHKGYSRKILNNQTICEFGKKILVQRKYNHLYDVYEVNNHLQLLFLLDGKYAPIIYLVTISKETLKLVSEIKIYNSFVDAGDIDINLGCFNNKRDSLTILDIHNSTTKGDWELADTLETIYSITKNGEINELSKQLISN
jgi:hypothetical protein